MQDEHQSDTRRETAQELSEAELSEAELEHAQGGTSIVGLGSAALTLPTPPIRICGLSLGWKGLRL